MLSTLQILIHLIHNSLVLQMKKLNQNIGLIQLSLTSLDNKEVTVLYFLTCIVLFI